MTENKLRAQQIANLRKASKSWMEIGEVLGISAATAASIYEDYNAEQKDTARVNRSTGQLYRVSRDEMRKEFKGMKTHLGTIPAEEAAFLRDYIETDMPAGEIAVKHKIAPDYVAKRAKQLMTKLKNNAKDPQRGLVKQVKLKIDFTNVEQMKKYEDVLTPNMKEIVFLVASKKLKNAAAAAEFMTTMTPRSATHLYSKAKARIVAAASTDRN